jgi:hypothetical protein
VRVSPGNIDPLYSKTGRLGNGGTATTFRTTTSTANTALTGAGTLDTDIWAAFTADATNGSFVRSIVAKIQSTGAGVASVLRIWINNGSTNATVTNNALYKEITLPAITATQTAATPDFEIPCNIMLPAGYRLLFAFGTAPVNIWMIYAIGGDY